MSVNNYNDLLEHVGHNVVVTAYGEMNVAVECEDCGEVLIDFDNTDMVEVL